MRKAFITKGLPASGKSTWAVEHSYAASCPTIRINNDDIRNEIYLKNGNRNWSKTIEKEVRFIREHKILAAFDCDFDIVVDNTHMNKFTLDQIVLFCKNTGYEVEIKDFTDVSVDECVRRDSLRTGNAKVGEAVIRKMYKESLPKEVRPEPPEFSENSLPLCIICDLDGTFFRMVNRGPYDEHLVYNDEPRLHVVMTIKALKFWTNIRNPINIFFFSGRSMKCYYETVRCINDKTPFFIGNDQSYQSLHMRGIDDVRRDSLVKMDMYNEHIKDKYNVLVVFDDRATVIRDCWKPLGLPVFRCGLIDADDF